MVIAAGFGMLAALAATAMATLCVWAGFFRTHLIVCAYLLILFAFSQTHMTPSGVVIPIYSRGVGTLFFPWFTWLLWILAAVAVLRDSALRVPAAACSMRPWILALMALFLAQSAVGFALGHPAQESLSSYGLINIVNGGVLALLMLRALDSRKALELLLGSAVILIAAHALYGLVRFAFFGGDPANPYDAYSYAAGAKLTYFDIGDNLLACIGAAYCGYRLLHDSSSLSKVQKWFFAGVVLLGVAIVVFSLRRTAWGGFALACALIVLVAPRQKRLAVGGFVAAAVGIGLIALFAKRFGVAWQHAQIGWEALYYDMVAGAHYGQSSLRALELRLGWEAYLESPIFGRGPWGRFEAYSGFGDGWHGGEKAFGFVHSGVLHLLFKSGLVGLAIFCGLIGAFFVFVTRVYPVLEPRYRAVLVMGVAGVLFLTPDLFFGTSFIQHRTPQLLGFCLALPYVAYNVMRRSTGPA